MIITAGVSANVTTTETLTLGVSTSPFNVQRLPAFSFANGTTGSAVDLHYEDSARTLAASASQTYTLSALTDSLGRTVAFVKVRALVIEVTSRTAGDFLTVGAAGTHPWTAILGGTTPTYIVWDMDLKVATQTDGFAVTSGTSDQLKVVNSGTHSITFNLYAIGTSA